MGAGQRAGVGGVEVAGQVVHEHQPGAVRRSVDGGLAGEERFGLGEQLDELLRSLGHGGNLLDRTDDGTCSRGRRCRIPMLPPRGCQCGGSLSGGVAGRSAGRDDRLADELGPGDVARMRASVPSGAISGERSSSWSRTYR